MSVFGGVDWDNIVKTWQHWVVNGSGLPSASVVFGQQDAPRPAAPAIVMRVSNVAEVGRAWVDREDNFLTWTPKVITAIDPVANTFACPAHAITNGTGPIRLDPTGALPAVASGLPLDTVTDYWLIAPDGDHLQLARSYIDTGGDPLVGNTNPITPIDITDAGTGTLSIISQPTTVAAGAELTEIVRGYLNVTLELRCHAVPTIGANMATSILQKVRTRAMFTSQQDVLHAVNVGFIECDRVRAVLGIRDALLFEPRAYLDVHFNVPINDVSTLRRIDKVLLVDQINNRTLTVGT